MNLWDFIPETLKTQWQHLSPNLNAVSHFRDIELDISEVNEAKENKFGERLIEVLNDTASPDVRFPMGEATIESQYKLSPKCKKRQLSPATIESQTNYFDELTKCRQLSQKCK